MGTLDDGVPKRGSGNNSLDDVGIVTIDGAWLEVCP